MSFGHGFRTWMAAILLASSTVCASTFMSLGPASAALPAIAWEVSTLGDGCVVDHIGTDVGNTQLRLFERTNGSVVIQVTNAEWNAEPGRESRLSLFLDGRIVSAREVGMTTSDGRKGFTAKLDARLLDAFAQARILRIERPDGPIADLSLGGSSTGIAALKACVSIWTPADREHLPPMVSHTPMAFDPAIIAPRPAEPRGDPGGWVTFRDYPLLAFRERREGTTHLKATINAEGRLADCVVVQSSGSPDLDAAACSKLLRIARFKPAVEAAGKPITFAFEAQVNWRIPPFAKNQWPITDGWSIMNQGIGCSMMRVFPDTGKSRLVLLGRADGSVLVHVTNFTWTGDIGKRSRLMLTFGQKQWSIEAIGVADNGRTGMMADVEGDILDALPGASRLTIERDGVSLTALPVDGSGAAVAALKLCVADVAGAEQKRSAGRATSTGEQMAARPTPPATFVTGPTVATPAEPRTDPAAWVTSDDYVLQAFREEREGVTWFVATIGIEGRITDCTITRSSGWPDLDQAGCQLIKRRAIFKPALDVAGVPVPTRIERSINWRMPDN